MLMQQKRRKGRHQHHQQQQQQKEVFRSDWLWSWWWCCRVVCCYVLFIIPVFTLLFSSSSSGCSYLAVASPLDPVRHMKDFDLNSWIRHYEPAHYDPSSLVVQHKQVSSSSSARVRRNSEDDGGQQRSRGRNHKQHHRDVVRLDIKGHDRLFKLRLIPDNTVFAEDVSFESTTRGRIHFDPQIVYTGTLEDDDSATVQGIITNEGLFEGTISTPLEDYHIEPVSRYLKSNDTQQPSSFHSIVYKSSDVRDPRRGLPCASHLLHLNLNKNNNNNNNNNYLGSKNYLDQKSVKRKRRWLLEAEAKHPYDDATYWHPNRTRHPSSYSPPFDMSQPIDEELDAGMSLAVNRTSNNDLSNLIFRNVNKRATVDPKKTTCMLYLQADHQFYQKYGTEEACIEVMTRHVQRVNSIYKGTDFNQDGKSDNITFMVKRIKVHTTDALRDPLYRFPNNYGVEKFLELFSEEDYDAFCLAYMFTYRDFEMGTLGLAWTGDLKNAGGVCEKNGHYRGSMKSLNTGIVTLLNYGKHVPPAVSHVTLAHEIGHNFGSPHDPEQCTPGGEDGNFIMFARATSGDKKNNNQFSPCSLKSINPVLNFKARSPKGCFTEPQASLCGNGVVEEGEECDCGWEEDCRDQCCFPQRRYPPLDEPPCRLTPRSLCSPSQGPCCTSECQVKFGDKCRDDNGCRDESFCNGRQPQCPPSVNKPNKTICNKELVCFMGECTGSICLAYGLESCQCMPRPGDPKTKACELCCKLPGDNQPCLSSFDWNDMPYDIPDMFAKPGTPCNDYSGYCDVFQMCREVDPSGPLATLRKLLFGEESFQSFKKWITDYWYAVAGFLTIAVTLLVLSTKYLSKKPNPKLKSITIMHSGSPTEAVRLPPDDDNTGQVTVHPAIRSKLPLKRKVRNGKIKNRKNRRKTTGKNESINNNLNSPSRGNVGNSKTASPKKKKRVSAPVVAEENRKNSATVDCVTVMEIPHSKVKKQSSKTRKAKAGNKNKEVIDYSNCQTQDADGNNKVKAEIVHGKNPLTAPDTDPVGKVQNWLLKSQYANLPKSKSTPVGLTNNLEKTSGKIRKIRPNTTTTTRTNAAADKYKKSHSVGNIPSSDKDKVRLQVVYKPPFKFSVKLKKPEKTTSVVIERAPPPDNNVSARKLDGKKVPRTGVLVRSTSKEQHLKKNQVNCSENIAVSPALGANCPSIPATSPCDEQKMQVDTPTKPVVAKMNSLLLGADDIDSNIHTVQSDLEVLLSESEYLFSDD